jgi:hypothetical protein
MLETNPGLLVCKVRALSLSHTPSPALFLAGCVFLGKSLTFSGLNFIIYIGSKSLTSLHPMLAEEFMRWSLATCKMLEFSVAAFPSLHFHEKDPGSAQFLWSQLCKQILGSTLIGALCESPALPVIHQHWAQTLPAGWIPQCMGSIFTERGLHVPGTRPASGWGRWLCT